MSNIDIERYQEFDYPHVVPDDPIIDSIKSVSLADLTPLENAFVRWQVALGSSPEAMTRVIHPAFPFDTAVHNETILLRRKTVADILRKIKLACPYLNLYTADYMAGILHEEIQHVRVTSRHARFTAPQGEYISGKKSPHEEEMADAAFLLECLTQMQNLRAALGNNPNGPSDTLTDGTSSGIARVIKQTEDFIAARANRTGGETDAGNSGAA